MEATVFETKQNIWRNVPYILMWLIPMLLIYFMTRDAGIAKLGAAPWMIGIYLMSTLFETRIHISDNQISSSTWFAGIKKLWNGKQYDLASFERAEVFRLNQNHVIILTRTADERVMINLKDFSNRDALIAHVGQHVLCDPTPILTDKYGLEDLGKRFGRVVFASAAVLLVAGILAFCFAIRIHYSPIQFHREFWLIIPLTMIGLYPYIKQDKKASPLGSTFFASLFLGSALAFAFFILLCILVT
jgi:hypothetical protein